MAGYLGKSFHQLDYGNAHPGPQIEGLRVEKVGRIQDPVLFLVSTLAWFQAEGRKEAEFRQGKSIRRLPPELSGNLHMRTASYLGFQSSSRKAS